MKEDFYRTVFSTLDSVGGYLVIAVWYVKYATRNLCKAGAKHFVPIFCHGNFARKPLVGQCKVLVRLN